MAGGRPTKYNEEIQAKADEYLETWEDNQTVPTVAGLSLHIGTPKSTMYDWAKVNDKFSDTLWILQAIQELNLVNKSLKNEINAQISKLMLANHDYSERQEIDHTSSDESMKPTVVTLVGKRADDS